MGLFCETEFEVAVVSGRIYLIVQLKYVNSLRFQFYNESEIH